MSVIEFRQMRSEDMAAVRKLCCQFLALEPLSKVLNADTIGGSDAYINQTFAACVNDGVSEVAVDPSTGEIVAFGLTAIVHKGVPDDLHFSKDDNATRSLAQVYEILDGLYRALGQDLFSKYKLDKLVNFRILFVSQKYQRQGIATNMVMKVLDLCRKKNIELVTAESTGAFSSRVFEKDGFEKLVEHYYDSVRLENEPLKLTEELKFHKSAALHVKQL